MAEDPGIRMRRLLFISLLTTMLGVAVMTSVIVVYGNQCRDDNNDKTGLLTVEIGSILLAAQTGYNKNETPPEDNNPVLTDSARKVPPEHDNEIKKMKPGATLADNETEQNSSLPPSFFRTNLLNFHH